MALEQSLHTTLPPGPSMPVPLQTLGWVTRPLPFLERCRQRYGDTFTLRIRNEATWVVLSDPEDVKRVFTGDPNVLRAGEANEILGPVVGSSSLLLLDEPQHMQDRKLMLPPFHGERMQGYRELIADVTRRELASWPTGEPFPLWPRMQAITLEVIMRAVFGIDDVGRLAHVRSVLEDALEWLTDHKRLAAMAMLGPQRLSSSARFKARLRPVDEALLAEIARRRQAPDLEDREDILSLFILARYEDGSQMSDAALRDELMTLLLAGHETTATSLAWAFERLLRHPDKLARLRDEVRARDEDTYLDAVVKETLRLRPVLPIVVRRLAAPFEVGGYQVPAGVALTPCIHLVHRRSDVYPQPHRFMPERFLESPAGTYTWIPFGGGVRRCLGASFAQFEMKQVLSTVLAELDLHATDARSETVVRRSITLTPDRGAVAVISRPASEPAPAARSAPVEVQQPEASVAAYEPVTEELAALADPRPAKRSTSAAARTNDSTSTAKTDSGAAKQQTRRPSAKAASGDRQSTRPKKPARQSSAKAVTGDQRSTRLGELAGRSSGKAATGDQRSTRSGELASRSSAKAASGDQRSKSAERSDRRSAVKGTTAAGRQKSTATPRATVSRATDSPASSRPQEADGEPVVRRTRPLRRTKRATPEEEQAALDALHGAGVA